MSVAGVPGLDIAGLTFDAGPVTSPALLRVGPSHGRHGRANPNDPTTLQDVFFRIGGPHVGKTTVSLAVNRNDVAGSVRTHEAWSCVNMGGGHSDRRQCQRQIVPGQMVAGARCLLPPPAAVTNL